MNIEAKACETYHVTYHHDYWAKNKGHKYGPLFSFAWFMNDTLVKIKKGKNEMDK